MALAASAGPTRGSKNRYKLPGPPSGTMGPRSTTSCTFSSFSMTIDFFYVKRHERFPLSVLRLFFRPRFDTSTGEYIREILFIEAQTRSRRPWSSPLSFSSSFSPFRRFAGHLDRDHGSAIYLAQEPLPLLGVSEALDSKSGLSVGYVISSELNISSWKIWRRESSLLSLLPNVN